MKKLLLAVSVFVLASCTASISIKAQEFNGDPGAQPLPEVAPLSPNKNKESVPNYPDTVQKTTMGCSMLHKFSDVREKWGERPLFSGLGLQLVIPPNVYGAPAKPIKRPMTLFVNQDTGTWTLVSFWTDNYACLVANGRDFVPGGSSFSDKGNL
jgi:hypothetical protein